MQRVPKGDCRALACCRVAGLQGCKSVSTRGGGEVLKGRKEDARLRVDRTADMDPELGAYRTEAAQL